MRPISRRDRKLLGSRRICTVNEPWIGELLPTIPHKGRRVLAPMRLLPLFDGLPNVGGEIIKTDIARTVEHLARAKLGTNYRATAMPSYAPKGYSCSTFVHWMFAFVGMYMPRYAIDQSYIGERLDAPGRPGLAFYRNRFPIRDRGRAVGHVGITTTRGTIIHGSHVAGQIVEEAIPSGAELFTDPFPKEPQLLLIIPNKIEGIETALDLARWLERPLRT